VRDIPLDRLIRKSLAAQKRRNPGPCVSENLMAAYLEESLSPDESAAFESHVSDCAACREVLALSMKLRPPEEEAFVPDVPPGSKNTLFHFSVPVPVLGALVVGIVLFAVYLRISNRPNENTISDRIAELRPSPQQVEAVAQDAPVAARANARVNKEAPQKKASIGSAAAMPADDYRKDAAKFPADENLTAAVPVVAIPPASPSPAGTLSAVLADSDLSAKQKSEVETKEATDQIASIRAQEPVSRPRVFAAANRIATTLYSSTPVEASLRFALTNLGANSKGNETREVGDRVFYRSSGFWIDRQCVEHSGNPIVEITTEDPEYKVILEKYPDVRSILPAAIFWEAKNYLLRQK
jgi:hypothetical protein